jgi:tol-pal system protein YbgF
MTIILRVSLFLSVVMLIASPMPASAQTTLAELNQLRSEVYQLRTEVYSLRQEAYNNQTSGNLGNSSASAGLELRIANVERALQNLTGLTERFGHQQNQLSKRVDALEARPIANAATPTQETTTASGVQTFSPKEEEELSFVAVPVPTPRPANSAASSTNAALGPENAYQQAFSLIQANDYAGAELELRDFVSKHPDHKLTANAHYWLGETYYARGQMDQASVAFAKGFQAAPSGAKAPDNLLKLSLALHQLGDTNQACNTLNALVDNYPNANVSILERTLEEQQRMACP